MARRAKGEGSIYHVTPVSCDVCPNRDGCVKKDDLGVKCSKRDRQDRWVYQYVASLPGGKTVRRSLTAKTKKELISKIDRQRLDAGPENSRDVSLGSFLDYWRDRCLPDTVQASTLEFYTSLLKYVPETLRKKLLADITPAMIQGMLSDLLAKGRIKKEGSLSVKTVRSVRTTLATAFEAAIDNGFLIKNPVKKTKPPVATKVREIVFLTQDEIKRLLKVADSGEYYETYPSVLEDDGILYLIRCYAMAVRLTLVTGMRWGETFGLKWLDVDFTGCTIYIHNNLQDGQLKRPKTSYSIRKISIDTDTMRRLKEWKKQQREYGKSVGDKYENKLDLLFTSISGVPVRYDN
ncbi:MAG: tyrosine-type recombinase/integrase, partial [Acidaminococcaceae bacterium]|nr:tyrosine-type recombinase/integrase [Acidaminococcaceae bacterium]MBQ5345185.1 tyrosine-type recombinase/integrase [Acidaminococcaceae bacterium]